jgi:hypothetical protein
MSCAGICYEVSIECFACSDVGLDQILITDNALQLYYFRIERVSCSGSITVIYLFLLFIKAWKLISQKENIDVGPPCLSRIGT